MDESELTERLDRRGWLEDARGAGCYALELSVPDDLLDVWMDHFDAAPAGFFDRFESAETALYVGASANVYERLCDHANGDVRKASVLRVCTPVDVADVQPHDDPYDAEYGFALDHADADTVVWVNGTVV